MKDTILRDSTGAPLAVGDHVMIYFGYNRLSPGVIHQIQRNSAKVLVDSWPSHPDPNHRYSLSKWKHGECMVKMPNPDRPYPDEVYNLLNEVRRIRDEECINADGLPVKRTCQRIINFWESKRPLNLVTS